MGQVGADAQRRQGGKERRARVFSAAAEHTNLTSLPLVLVVGQRRHQRTHASGQRGGVCHATHDEASSRLLCSGKPQAAARRQQHAPAVRDAFGRGARCGAGERSARLGVARIRAPPRRHVTVGTPATPPGAMSGGFRVLHLVRPFLSVLPEVEQANRKVPFREKALYTGVSLFVFLVCSQCVPARVVARRRGQRPREAQFRGCRADGRRAAPAAGCRSMASTPPAALIRCTGRASSWRPTAGRAWSSAFRQSSRQAW